MRRHGTEPAARLELRTGPCACACADITGVAGQSRREVDPRVDSVDRHRDLAFEVVFTGPGGTRCAVVDLHAAQHWSSDSPSWR